MSMETEKRCSETLIVSLCCELECVRVMHHPFRRVLPWILLAALYVSGSVYLFGLRGDFFDLIYNQSYVFELAITLFMSLSAAFCATWLCIPDMRGQKWMIAVPATFFAVLILWLLTKAALQAFILPVMEWHICFTAAAIFGLIPAAAIFVLSVAGKTTSPILLSFMNTLAVGGFGYIGLRLTCASDDIGHLCCYHILPYMLFGLLAALISRRIYRW